MVRGIYTAAAGAMVAQYDTDTIANNLANVSTVGFKRTLMQVQSTETMPIYRVQTDPGTTPGTTVPGKPASDYLGQLGFGSYVYDTPADFEQGSLQQTASPLDLAISGPGFFTIATANGIRYTRDGNFTVNANSQLVTQSGDLVLSQSGPVTMPVGKVSIQPSGEIDVFDPNAPTQGPLPVATLRLTEFGNLTGLRPEGSNLFVDSGVASPQTATQSSLSQGYLEASNANVIQSMVGLITSQQWFNANVKMIQTQDTLNSEAITSVGQNT
ncbi:MAG: flagellar hook-basal body protein [Candidatus Eremiobacteraeota bacterium]|nr:flagellar hook-basal body protein [Candidatus Eremiobacteraeota bacterium]